MRSEIRPALILVFAAFACAHPQRTATEPAQPKCAAGEQWDGTGCAQPQVVARAEDCPAGYRREGEGCVPALDCPEGSHVEDIRCVADVAPPEPEPAPAPPPETQPSSAPAVSPSKPDARDPRAHRPPPRDILVAELQALERLLSLTSKTSPDRVVVLRRLAEDYVDLEYSAEHGTEPNPQKIIQAARKKAIEHYRRIKDEYPTYAKLDEVLYFAGYEYERAGDPANARAMYRDLANKFPSSSYLARVPAKLRPH